jgi:hypothetical protein
VTDEPVEERLAREAEQRPRVVPAAIVAGLLTITGTLLFFRGTSDGPDSDEDEISLLDALSSAVQGTEPSTPSLAVRQAEALGDNVAILAAGTILSSIAAALALYVLFHLDVAAQARSPRPSKVPRIAIAVGALVPIGFLLYQLPIWFAASGFDGTTAGEARDTLAPSISRIGQGLYSLGNFGFGLAFVVVSIAAMRTGLLTRFMGILGAIVGVLVILPLDQPQIVRAIWLGMVGFLLAGRTRHGMLPAWQTGRAEPWLTQQQVREQREAAAEPATAGAPVAEPAPAESPAERRKRKRRR